MATVPVIPKAAPSAKYDAQVTAQLARAERRVRSLDLTVGLLGLLAVSLGFVLVMVLLHWQLNLSATARLIGLVLYLLGAGAYLTWKVILPWRRPINPRFAALQLERTLPGSKNSVVNFVDLREENLPPAIRGALCRRAAKDASQVDIEQAISGRNANRAGGVAGIIAFLFLVMMFTVGFRDFFRLLGGVLAPTNPAQNVENIQKNRILLRLPEGGNTMVAAGSPVSFSVRVEGNLSPGETPQLIRTYPNSKNGDVRPIGMERNSAGDWTTVVEAKEVGEGFTYKLTAGDAESPEYRVGVYFPPAPTKFQAVYLFPTYVGEPHKKVQIENRRLQAWRGTEVALRIQTNCAVSKAQLEITGKDGTQRFDATVAKDDPEAFEARFVITENATYRLNFTSSRDEKYIDPLLYEIIAEEDKPPHKVEMTKPADKITLQTNQLLKVEGVAEDDIGVKALTLHMQAIQGETATILASKPYRSDEELRLPGSEDQVNRGGHGGYLKKLEYKDAVDLKTVQDKNGKPFTLKGGMELEYWLGARDARNNPANPETFSKHQRVKLTEPERKPGQEKQEKQERDQARKEQKEHEAKQDQELQKEEKQRDKDQQEEAKKEQQAGKKGEPEQKPGDPKPDENLDAEKQNKKNELDKNSEANERLNLEQKPGEKDSPKKPEEKQGKPGEGKGDGEPKPAESKPADPKQGGKEGDPKPNERGDGKPESKPGDSKKAGECKECKNPGGQGDGKEGGKENPMSGQKGDGKNGAPSGEPMGPDQKPGAAKNDGDPKKNESASNSGAGKTSEPMSASKTAEGKSGGKGQPDAKDQAKGKEEGSEGKVADGKKPGDSKEKPEQNSASAGAKGKEEGPKGMSGDSPASAKGTDSGKGGQGERKPEPSPSTGQQTANAKGEPEKSKDAGGDVSKIDAKNPSAQDLQNLVDALKNGDQEQVGKALDKLEEIGQKAEDPNVREPANKLMDDLKKYMEAKQQQEQRQRGDAKPGPEKPERPDMPPEEQNAKVKVKVAPGNDEKEIGKPKQEPGQPTVKKGTEKGQGRKEPAQVDPKLPPELGKDEMPDPTQPTVKGPKSPLGRNSSDEKTEAHNPDGPVKPSNPLKQPNSTLQLEKFDRNKYLDQTDKVVKDAKPPVKETKPTTTPEPAEKVDPIKGGTLPTVTGRKVDPKDTTATGPVDGRIPAPPGYRKTASEFTKIRRQPETEKKDPK